LVFAALSWAAILALLLSLEGAIARTFRQFFPMGSNSKIRKRPQRRERARPKLWSQIASLAESKRASAQGAEALYTLRGILNQTVQTHSTRQLFPKPETSAVRGYGFSEVIGENVTRQCQLFANPQLHHSREVSKCRRQHSTMSVLLPMGPSDPRTRPAITTPS
jgi:hypothetical protein